ncbi:adhesive plaque matrix protein-like [Musca vetustissima]|uniref:adhesive plaque matrix protein-like n=1 Tax=Musca vetustissima TaxID=27455 RepID=UPI002AB68DEC|nr:adhesive plaque matrix protein-like [Musca vetustissima]
MHFNTPAGDAGSSSGRTQAIRIQHINAPPGFPLDDPNLDATLLRIVSDGGATTENKHSRVEENEVQQQQTAFVNSYKAPDYLPPKQETPYQGSPYLPPVSGSAENSGVVFKGSEYLPPQTSNENRAFKGPDYLPPNGGVSNNPNPFPSNNQFKGPDYLPPPQASGQQYKGPEYLPPTGGVNQQGSYQETTSQGVVSNNQQQYKAPEYLPPTNTPFKGPDYLPPQPSVSGGASNQVQYQTNTPFKGPDYLPPLANTNAAPSQSITSNGQTPYNNPFKGPDYLPPPPSNSFKGPEYLPPQVSSTQQSVVENVYIPSGVLPPGYDFVKPENAEAAINELHTLPDDDTNTFSNTNNNINNQEVTVRAHLQVSSGGQVEARNVGTYQAPGYLPPVRQQSSDIIYGTAKPGNGPVSPTAGVSAYQTAGSFAGQQSQPQGGTYQAPGYLPPASPQQPQTQGESYQAPPYLPPVSTQQTQSVTYQAPASSQQSQQTPGVTYQAQVSSQQAHQTQSVTYQAPAYLPPVPQQQSQGGSYPAPGYLPPSPAQVNTNGAQHKQATTGYLPPGYDFQKPVEAEVQQAPNTQSQTVQQTTIVGNNNFKAPSYLPPVSQPPFKGPEYLPPTNNAEQSSGVVTSSSVSQVSTSTLQTPGFLAPSGFKASAYLPPTSNEPRPSYALPSTFQGPGYLPPFVNSAQSQASYMHPLSSYMTSVQPYERYGSARKPFAQYGPPPAAAAATSVAINTNDVAPMYKEPATRPQYYAPAMSYAQNTISTQAYRSHEVSNSFTSSALNQQTRQALQAFMPKDLRQEISTGHSNVGISSTPTPKVAGAPKASAKIRTVQIVNTNAVKTLKVLESLDHSGVKTIKILGTSNEEPMGEHRVVKVVTDHKHEVQTVKIFNDHQDVSEHQSSSGESRGYLPPRQKRNHKKVTPRGRKRINGGQSQITTSNSQTPWNNPFKGPPPTSSFKAPEYLPPQHEKVEAAIYELHTLPDDDTNTSTNKYNISN